jgi:hypothetical protein
LEIEANCLIAPAVVAGTHDKKTDETKPELSTTKSMDTHEKKGGKRSSIFGTFFGGRKDVTSPTGEKTENGVAPVVPAKDTEVAPVAETAPKIDEPVQSKPIDTAAVTAPVDTALAAHDLPANSVHAQTTTGSTTTKSPTTPSHKGGVMGFFKRQDSKTEVCQRQKRAITTADNPYSRRRPTSRSHHLPLPPKRVLLPSLPLLLPLKQSQP